MHLEQRWLCRRRSRSTPAARTSRRSSGSPGRSTRWSPRGPTALHQQLVQHAGGPVGVGSVDLRGATLTGAIVARSAQRRAGDRTHGQRRSVHRPVRTDRWWPPPSTTAPASRQCVFELFTRRLPDRSSVRVVAGTGRLLDVDEPVHRSTTRSCRYSSGDGRRPTHPRLARRLPVRRRRRRLRRGRALLPGVAASSR